jgi:Tfp pilus assembly protein PilE
MGIARKHLKTIAGVSLVEVMVTIFIAGIAMSGLVIAYTDGIRAWKSAAEKMALYNEGTSALSLMERFVRDATYVSTGTTNGVPSNYMDLKVLVRRGNTDIERGAKFYFYTADATVRWNNLTGTQGIYNIRLLPLSNFRYRPGETPYLEVQRAEFTPMDPIRPDNPTTSGYGLIKIDLLLNDSRGDTLNLTSLVSKRNSPN